MNWVDLALIVLAAVSIASGLREGLSRSGFGLLAIGIAFLAAAWLYPTKPAGFVIVFVLAIAIAAMSAALLGVWFRRTGLSWLDRILGGVFGLANTLLFAALAMLALMAFAPRIPRHYAAHSTFAPYALSAAHAAAEIVPEEMKWRVEETYRGLVTLLPPKWRRSAPPPRQF